MQQLYSDTMMDAFRQEGDAVADEAIAKLLAGSPEAKRKFWKFLLKPEPNARPLPLAYAATIQHYFPDYQQLPAWADRELLKVSHRFFQTYTQDNFLLLGMLALPYCYACGNGARVLLKTGRLQQDGPKRLLETARFIFDVMEPKAFYPQGFGWKAMLKVRLLHAAVRHSILQKDASWQTAEWGIPVNQEDMTGTNMAFSFVIIRGLEQIGYSVPRQQKEAYLHAWNIVGHKLGIRQELLPTNWQEAATLVDRISERQIAPSEAGRELAHALLHGIEASDRHTLPKGYATALMHELLGERIASILDLPAPTPTSRVALTRTFNRLLSQSPFFAPLNQVRYRLIKDQLLKAS